MEKLKNFFILCKSNWKAMLIYGFICIVIGVGLGIAVIGKIIASLK